MITADNLPALLSDLFLGTSNIMTSETHVDTQIKITYNGTTENYQYVDGSNTITIWTRLTKFSSLLNDSERHAFSAMRNRLLMPRLIAPVAMFALDQELNDAETIVMPGNDLTVAQLAQIWTTYSALNAFVVNFMTIEDFIAAIEALPAAQRSLEADESLTSARSLLKTKSAKTRDLSNLEQFKYELDTFYACIRAVFIDNEEQGYSSDLFVSFDNVVLSNQFRALFDLAVVNGATDAQIIRTSPLYSAEYSAALAVRRSQPQQFYPGVRALPQFV